MTGKEVNSENQFKLLSLFSNAFAVESEHHEMITYANRMTSLWVFLYRCQTAKVFNITDITHSQFCLVFVRWNTKLVFYRSQPQRTKQMST